MSRTISMKFNDKDVHVLDAFEVLSKEQRVSRHEAMLICMRQFNLEHDPDGLVRGACGDPNFSTPEILR